MSALKAFGFVGIDAGVIDPYVPGTNYLSETASFTNIAHLVTGSVGATDIRPRVSAMITAGVKPIVDVSALFFYKPANTLKLRPDYATQWAAFTSTSQVSTFLPYIAAFYIADEPYYQNCTYADLNTAVSTVKASFPTIPTTFIEAYLAVSGMIVPAKFDLVGFDMYQVDPLGSAYQTLLRTLKSALVKSPWRGRAR